MKRKSLNPMVIIAIGGGVAVASFFLNGFAFLGAFTLFMGFGALMFLYGFVRWMVKPKPKKEASHVVHAQQHQSYQAHPHNQYQQAYHVQHKYCPHCRTAVHPNAKYCHSCGAKLE